MKKQMKGGGGDCGAFMFPQRIINDQRVKQAHYVPGLVSPCLVELPTKVEAKKSKGGGVGGKIVRQIWMKLWRVSPSRVEDVLTTQ